MSQNGTVLGMVSKTVTYLPLTRRYYVDGTTDTLWEEWFYCYDLGVQLKPVIER